ncbi:MAG: hypothetical protein GAK30_01544 [Paracidovorax wautersii]|uniref:Uncharacterized protein n=1 Tax=Paracidovorax wautersii TaxID=1177982 RepID=A0A7V8FPQ0_9BURK|nr:MAG: hypothetical protein GAK30_01544 [Paracidovorax wautersii]
MKTRYIHRAAVQARQTKTQVGPTPFAIAANRAAKLQPDELAAIIRPTTASINALIAGQGTHDDWSITRGAHLIALAIERSGIVCGQLPALDQAGQTLGAIFARAVDGGQWHAPAVTAIEAQALLFLRDLFRGQLQHVSRGELSRISKKAEAQLRAQGLHIERKAA